jgi:hypothetical protein
MRLDIIGGEDGKVDAMDSLGVAGACDKRSCSEKTIKKAFFVSFGFPSEVHRSFGAHLDFRED